MKKASKMGCQWQLKSKRECGNKVQSGTVFCERHLLEARLETARFLLSSALILAKAKKHTQLTKLLEEHAAKIGKAECGGNVSPSEAAKMVKSLINSAKRNLGYTGDLIISATLYAKARALVKETP